MKLIGSILLMLVMAVSASARTTYVVWNATPASGNEEWIKTDYYIWEHTYTQTNVDDALEFTASGSGWIGGGYESVTPFDNRVLTEGYDLVFDIKTSDPEDLSVQLTSASPEAAQSVKLSFARDNGWHTIRLSVRKDFPKVCKAWAKGGRGYVFSIVGGAPGHSKLLLRNIRYEKTVD